ncbi:Uncharacterised protein [uncultured archaeon]|nr:Uncharacterised protein [uncultured archaeon]
MNKLKVWLRSSKHSDTPRDVFINVTGYDRVRTVLIGRCRVCDYVISSDPEKVREIVYDCGNVRCCVPTGYRSPANAHAVCNLCYDMFHALYVNYKMTNMNYFKELDEREKRDKGDDPKRRDRMGL